MKTILKLSLLFIFFILSTVISYSNPADFGYQPLRDKIRYKEDFFRLYNQWLYSDMDSVSRNIFFLELAYSVPNDHPIRAITYITNEIQYERYKDLLMTHICRLLTQEYINYGYLYMKEHIFFFNKEFKKEYLDGYDIAEFYFTQARKYWDQAIGFAQAADGIKGYRTDLENMEDEVYRMKTGDLNYYKVIDNLFVRINRNRSEIQRLWP